MRLKYHLKKLTSSPRLRRTLLLVSLWLIAFIVVSTSTLEPVLAANGFADPNGDGSTGSWSSTGANFYTEIDEGVRQPTVPTLTDTVTADAASGGNLFLRMGTIASDIYMVTRLRVRVYHNDGSNGRVNVQLFDDDESTALTSEVTIGRNNSSDGWDIANFAGLQMLPSQLDTLSVRLRPSLHNGANPSNTVTVYAMYLQITYDRLPRFRQAAYRFFNNDNSIDVGTAIGGQDSNIVLASAGDAFRLRILLDVQRATIPIDMESFKLQFVDPGTGTCASPSGGTPATYTDVTGSTVIAFNDNASPADEDALTANVNDPVHDSDTTYNQSYQEANNFSNSEAEIPINQSAMWDFSLIDNSAPSETSYCFKITETDGSDIFSYDEYPVVTTPGGTLTVDVVNSSGVPVASPSRPMTTTGFGFECQTTTGQIGVGQQRVRVDNGTGNAEWNLTIAATGGPTDTWDAGANDYDFNDPGGSPAGCGDGGDTDGLAGQLEFDLSAINITEQSGCSENGLTSGSSVGFEEGVTDSVTLMTAGSTADTGCYWDFRNMDVSQQIPPEQINDSYSINLTITVTAI